METDDLSRALAVPGVLSLPFCTELEPDQSRGERRPWALVCHMYGKNLVFKSLQPLFCFPLYQGMSLGSGRTYILVVRNYNFPH